MLKSFIVAIIGAIPLVYRCFPLARINGRSMFPTLQEGQVVVANRFFKLTEGDIYIYKHDDKLVIKRLKSVYRTNTKSYCYFLGDNSAESYDSRHYGFIKVEDIIAKVIWYKKN